VTNLALEESIARLAPALDEMRSAVHQHGGIIHREMGDGIFAVFGAPVAEDLHAVMACLSALDLLRRIEALGDPGFRVRIGVHSGLVIAGPRQLDYNRSYDFDGPPLTMAERLQAAAAPGQALASEACRALAAGYVQFGAAKKLSLKGFLDPIPAYSVEDVGELSTWRVNLARGITAFVGRDAEFSHLLALAESGKAVGRGATVIVSGEPGVGKSRLVHECLDVLRGREWQSIVGECSSIIGHSPFSLLKTILSDVAEGLGETETATARTELPSAQLAALDVVLDGAHPVPPAWAGLTPRARGRAIVEATSALVRRRIGSQPTLLLIEDLQWADEASTPALEAIANLTRQLPFLVLATVRTGGVPAWLEKQAPIQLSLTALDSGAGSAMLDQLLGRSPRLAALKGRILTHTGAMPLFIEEVCRDLAEAGKLAGSPGNFEPATEAAELGVPATLQGVIASRIDRLSPPEKRLLQVAAAIGAQVPNRLLQAISALQEIAFQNATAALLATGLLVPVPELGQASNAFPHDLVRQVAYDAVLGPDKLALHKRILAELEAEAAAGQATPEVAAAIVHHALLAREWASSAKYAVAIARQCLAQSALPDAMRYFETAIGAVDQMPASTEREAKAVDLRIESRLAYANLGKLKRWLDLAKQAETRAQTAGDETRRVAALAMRAAAVVFCGTPAEAVEAGEAAVREAEHKGQPGWLAYAEYGLGQAHYVAGQYGEAVEILERAYERFSTDGAAPPPGGTAAQAALLCCMMTCIIQSAVGDDAAAASAQSRADAIAAREGGPMSAIAAGFSRGVLFLSRNDIKAAETILADALKSARQLDINLFVPVLAHQHGLALLRVGDADGARADMQAARAEAERLEHRSIGLRAEIGLALCDASSQAGRSAALEAVSRCEQTARQEGFQALELEALLIKTALLRVMGRKEWVRWQTAAEQIAVRVRSGGMQRDLSRLLAQLVGPRDSEAKHG
jgi:tetratricopeptide (TPR) repeat protein